MRGKVSIGFLAAMFCVHSFFPNRAHSQSEEVKEAWVRRYASKLAPTFDLAADVAVDNAGNVYVTGSSSNFTTGVDYVTIKYGANGNQAWLARYSSASMNDDLPAAITADLAGNVYVTGTTGSTRTTGDYTTVKYNSEGAQEWTAHYNGAADNCDNARALAVDELGNVYVTGSSVGIFHDFATIKYDAAGEEKWVARHAGLVNSYAEVAGLAVSSEGNVYVAGWSLESSIHLTNYITIKYDSAGQELWSKDYTGPGRSDNYASALALDNKENVYVTGSSGEPGSNDDYATIKYDSTGALQWDALYNGTGNDDDKAWALAVDIEGNVYVTGQSISDGINHDDDYATVKYDGAGAAQWVMRYNGPANAGDVAKTIAVDPAQNIIVAGYSHGVTTSFDFAILKYSSQGIQNWATRFHVPADRFGGKNDFVTALALDPSGQAYATGYSRGYGIEPDEDYSTIALDQSGAIRWFARFNGVGNTKEEITDMAVDANGNVYLTGWSLASETSRDYLTVKYNSLGELQWAVRHNEGPDSFDEANALAVDPAGNVYVTGSTYQLSESACATIKYNAAGEPQWIARYRGARNDYNGGEDLMLDAQGNVYVTGWSTLKYDNAGVLQWALDYVDSRPPYTAISAKIIARDAAGNVYISGGIYSGGRFAKLNPQGGLEWSTAARLESTSGFAVDDSGNVYLTGWFEWGHGVSPYETFKYNTEGVLQWTASYHQAYNGDDKTSALALDGSGNVYVTGRSGVDCATIKYNSLGEQQWLVRYNSPGHNSMQPTAMTQDAFGNIYVTGYGPFRSGQSASVDFITVKYDNAGLERWSVINKGPNGSLTYPVKLAVGVDNAGNIILAGTTRISGDYPGRENSFFTIIKYAQTPVTVEEQPQELPASYHLAQNYPNPFRTATLIRYALPQAEHVSLKIFNLAGQEIITVLDEKKAPGAYEARWYPEDLPSGIYIYQFQAGAFVAQKKLLHLR